MRLSARSRYGTRMMIDIAQHCDDGPVRIQDISRRQGISNKFLEQLVIPLMKANILKSIRGPKGGYILAKRPAEISVGEIVELLEDQKSLVGCVDNPMDCQRAEGCPTRIIWEKATRSVFKELNAIRLSDILMKDVFSV